MKAEGNAEDAWITQSCGSCGAEVRSAKSELGQRKSCAGCGADLVVMYPIGVGIGRRGRKPAVEAHRPAQSPPPAARVVEDRRIPSVPAASALPRAGERAGRIVFGGVALGLAVVLGGYGAFKGAHALQSGLGPGASEGAAILDGIGSATLWWSRAIGSLTEIQNDRRDIPFFQESKMATAEAAARKNMAGNLSALADHKRRAANEFENVLRLAARDPSLVHQELEAALAESRKNAHPERQAAIEVVKAMLADPELSDPNALKRVVLRHLDPVFPKE